VFTDWISQSRIMLFGVGKVMTVQAQYDMIQRKLCVPITTREYGRLSAVSDIVIAELAATDDARSG
jgi:hypothetical protein